MGGPAMLILFGAVLLWLAVTGRAAKVVKALTGG